MTLTGESRPLTFLVALDGRVGPVWVADQAIRLASVQGGVVLGLSTLTGRDAQAALHAFQARCELARVTGHTLHLPGSRFQSLMATIERADLVMVAWTPASAHLFNLSTFSALLRHATRPIWVTPSSAQVPVELTVAFHGQRKAFHAITEAARLAQAWHLPVDTLVVAEGADINDHDVLIARQELQARGVMERTSRYERGVPGEVLAATTAPQGVLVMGGAGDGPLFGLTHSRVVRQVLRAPQGPVLICP